MLYLNLQIKRAFGITKYPKFFGVNTVKTETSNKSDLIREIFCMSDREIKYYTDIISSIKAIKKLK